MTESEEVVDRVYAAFLAGDPDEALRHCAPDAQWHAITPGTPWTGSHSLRAYLTEILPSAVAEMPGYAVEIFEREVIDELVVARVRSTHGSGVMVFRVAGGKLTDIWVMNSKGREATAAF